MNHYDRALAELRSRGMCKNRLEDSDGHVCLRGALNLGLHKSTNFWAEHGISAAEHQLLNQVACDLYPERLGDFDPSGGAPAVNNHPATTQEDAELILKHASYEWDLLHPEGAS